MKSFLAVTALLGLTVFAANVSAQHHDQRITGIYSSLHRNAETGDLSGTELLIIPSNPGYIAFVQLAEGGVPSVAVAPVLVNGSRIELTMPLAAVPGGVRFTGSIKGNKLVGSWQYSGQEVLRRGTSYWH